MEIFVINPTITARWEEDTRRTYTDAGRPDTIIRVVTLEWGTASIESYRDEALVTPGILTEAVLAEQAGADCPGQRPHERDAPGASVDRGVS